MRAAPSVRSMVNRVRWAVWHAGLVRQKPWDSSIIALHEFQTLYVVVPKVAYSSLTSVCVDALGIELPEGAWKPAVFRGARFDDVIDTRKRDAAKVNRWEAARYAGYWKFAFVRNPFDRLVSCYSEKIRDDGPEGLFVDGVHRSLREYGVFRRGMSFEAFASAVAEIPDRDSDMHFRSQATFVADAHGNLSVDFLGRFERLNEGVQLVARRLGVSVALPHLLKSERRPFQEYYDETLRRTVARRYEADLRLFGYEDSFVAGAERRLA